MKDTERANGWERVFGKIYWLWLHQMHHLHSYISACGFLMQTNFDEIITYAAFNLEAKANISQFIMMLMPTYDLMGAEWYEANAGVFQEPEKNDILPSNLSIDFIFFILLFLLFLFINLSIFELLRLFWKQNVNETHQTPQSISMRWLTFVCISKWM